MLRIVRTQSFSDAVEEIAFAHAGAGAEESSRFLFALGAAMERICENPDIGPSLGGVLRRHEIVGSPFVILYEVTDDDLCFLYVARRAST